MNTSPKPLSLHQIPGVPEIRPGDDLAGIILDRCRQADLDVADGDIFVIAQKIVSKSEGRMVRLDTVTPSARARELAGTCNKDPRLVELVLAESATVVRCRPGVIIVTDRRGFVMANAGIDQSNVGGDDETALLLPVAPDESARHIRERLMAATGRTLGVVINDSFGRAWRMGTVGTAIGVAGLPGLIDLRGRSDRHGRTLQSSELGVADEVAAAASLMMGQAGEGFPIVRVRGFPYPLRDGSAAELLRPAKMDLFREPDL